MLSLPLHGPGRGLRASLAAAAALLLAPPAALPSPRQEASVAQPGEESPPELSIRNATDSGVSYRIQPFDSLEEAPLRLLPAGEIARFRTWISMDLTFESEGRHHEYRLSPGGVYGFRHDYDGSVDLYLGSHAREDAPDLAPYVATPMPVVERMLALAGVGSQDVVYDLGCGDGRIVVTAAARYGARGVGVDLDPVRIAESNRLAQREQVEELVEFHVADVMAVDFSEATVVGLYLLPESNEMLRPIMEEQLAPGSRVVSHNYEVGGWTPVHEESMLDEADTTHHLFLYVVGGEAEP